ncbi:MAG: DNA alkylation repair protein [Clostridia bacterium]|nr:DNA alkylation repair protein [Clostridia bacterium]
MVNDIKKKLLELQNEEYKNFNKKLCPDTNLKILGIKIPVLRAIAKEIVKDNPGEYLKNVKNKYFEEVILEGLVIAYSKMPIEEKLELIKNFIPKIDSWAINDTFCPTLKIKDSEKELVWNFLQQYLKSEKEFEVRFAVIMMLDYYITDEYVDRVILKLDQVKNDGYYAKMAVAWTIAEIGVKYNEKAIEYLKGQNNLDKFTYNKALQKLRESYRITPEQKEELKKMYRK